MAIRRLSSAFTVLVVVLVSCFVITGCMLRADAMVDPSSNEQNTQAAAAGNNQTQAASETGSRKKTKNSSSSVVIGNSNESSNNGSNSGSSGSGSGNSSGSDDEDVLSENAFTTPGNASVGDMIKSSGSKDFYTIRTENDKTYYLVIDHSGNMDNVYMLSTIDENDLKDFMEDGESGSSLILPETKEQETTEPEPETADEDTVEDRIPGIISLVILIAAGIAGLTFYKRSRRDGDEPEEDYSENMEGDGLPTVNEDEEFL